MPLNRTLWAGTGVVTAATILGVVFGPPSTPRASAASVQVTVWSSDLFGTYTHPGAVQFAATHEEFGFTDWRLPTVNELVAAVTDGDPWTFGQTPNPGTSLLYWTSKKQGNMWAYAVEVVTDANGYPDPNLSGRVLKLTRTSAIHVRCVRP